MTTIHRVAGIRQNEFTIEILMSLDFKSWMLTVAENVSQSENYGQLVVILGLLI